MLLRIILWLYGVMLAVSLVLEHTPMLAIAP
jgi:hypothetical protein